MHARSLHVVRSLTRAEQKRMNPTAHELRFNREARHCAMAVHSVPWAVCGAVVLVVLQLQTVHDGAELIGIGLTSQRIDRLLKNEMALQVCLPAARPARTSDIYNSLITHAIAIGGPHACMNCSSRHAWCIYCKRDVCMRTGGMHKAWPCICTFRTCRHEPGRCMRVAVHTLSVNWSARRHAEASCTDLRVYIPHATMQCGVHAFMRAYTIHASIACAGCLHVRTVLLAARGCIRQLRGLCTKPRKETTKSLPASDVWLLQ